MNDFWIAVALSVVSALCYGGGAVAQRRLASLLNGRSRTRSALRALLEQRLWWLSVALNALGALLHAVALVYGALIVVQPLGTLTLVFALPWSAWLAGRRVGPREWHGAVLTVLALAVMLATTSQDSSGHPLRDDSVPLVLLLTLAVLAVMGLAASRTAHPVRRSLLFAAASGVAFGVASALTKTVLTQFSLSGPMGLVDWSPVGLALLACAGLLLSQAAYRDMGVGAPLATMTLANPATAVVVGVVFMDETYLAGVWGAGVSLLAGIVAVRGIVLLSTPEPAAPAPSLTSRR
ncbi:DMT family transporter [Marinactinospora thermotolerans]|uniref:Magnesium transporter NIPA n=1 Tax=Marinactinospora thermotolerans DSM 45154 TaxID=1122192 RepID=A0A1T4P9V6_9ACTN|nr:DMT family transporter [Marinactinospora thermotolerans]SJZ88239.1 hypothetical protein SAMN02745673_01690 [Marinactinospora thermotolerans DSM 45154]